MSLCTLIFGRLGGVLATISDLPSSSSSVTDMAMPSDSVSTTTDTGAVARSLLTMVYVIQYRCVRCWCVVTYDSLCIDTTQLLRHKNQFSEYDYCVVCIV